MSDGLLPDHQFFTTPVVDAHFSQTAFLPEDQWAEYNCFPSDLCCPLWLWIYSDRDILLFVPPQAKAALTQPFGSRYNKAGTGGIPPHERLTIKSQPRK